MLYGTTLNGPLVQAVKKGRNASPMELLEMETFSLRLKACEKERENEVMAEKALRDEVVAAETEETEESKLASGKLAPVPSKYQRGSVEHWTATAAQQLNVYVSLLTEPDTQAGLEKLISESPLSRSSIEGEVGKNMVMIHFDADLCGDWILLEQHFTFLQNWSRMYLCCALRIRLRIRTEASLPSGQTAALR